MAGSLSRMPLDRQDQKRADELIRRTFPAAIRVAKRLGLPSPLHYLLDSWSAFVGEVEAGYRLSVFDYTRELDMRDILCEVCRELSDDGRWRVASVVEPLDARLLAATVPIPKPIETPPGVQKHWWWCRIPRALPDQLWSDLARDGLL